MVAAAHRKLAAMITDLTKWRRERQVAQVMRELAVRWQYRGRLDAAVRQRTYHQFLSIVSERAIAIRIATCGYSAGESVELLRMLR